MEHQKRTCVPIIDMDDDTCTTTSESFKELHCTTLKCGRSRLALTSSTNTNDPGSSSSSSSSSTCEIVEQKRKFLIFMRILLKYLQQRDATRHAQVTVVLRSFVASLAGQQRPSRPNQHYTILEMYTLVKSMVTETQWKDTLCVLRYYLNHVRWTEKYHRTIPTRVIISPDGS